MTTADIPSWIALLAAALLVLGGLLAVIGSLGLLRLPNFYARMHGPSMGNTLGAGCVLVASMLVSSALAGWVLVHEVIITVFVVTTSPMTAMLLMRAAVFRTPRGRSDAGLS